MAKNIKVMRTIKPINKGLFVVQRRFSLVEKETSALGALGADSDIQIQCDKVYNI